MSYVFGPVPSRRLGRSLGVDVVPFKTCSYDCIYCQLGWTTSKTVERKAWVPLDEVLEQLKDKLSSQPDYITLSGSGEPTLFSQMGELIDGIKALTDVPVAVLTNGSLLWREDVQNELMRADLVVPSLDAGSEAMFDAVNRPHEDISFDKMLGGLIEFRRAFTGQYWLENFLLGGYTADASELADLAGSVGRIQPDRVQLNTVTRPPAENFAVGVPRARMDEFARLFTPCGEVIADYHNVHEQKDFTASQAEVLNMLRRRPCSIQDIAGGLGMHQNEVVKYTEELMAQGKIVYTLTGGRLFYKISDSASEAGSQEVRAGTPSMSSPVETLLAA
jgi:wyosine [tRNA(Phe)-imidazoG37] synthetase (radical SAM superfamily)